MNKIILPSMWVYVARVGFPIPSKPVFRLCVGCTRNYFRNVRARPSVFNQDGFLKPIIRPAKRTFSFTFKKHSGTVKDNGPKNTKLKKYELKRLISLMKEEKFKLSGKRNDCMVLTNTKSDEFILISISLQEPLYYFLSRVL